MSPQQFWRCSPRKFAALCRVHEDLNTPKDDKTPKQKTKTPAKEKQVYIDQILM